MSFITKSSVGASDLLPASALAFSQAVAEKDKRDILQRARELLLQPAETGTGEF